jgi:ferredoxin
MAKLKIRMNNNDVCIGCASCVCLAMDVFEINEEGVSVIKDGVEGIEDLSSDKKSATITDLNLIEQVKEVVNSSVCPLGLIEIVSEE